MPNLLVSNDDGPESPLVLAFLRELRTSMPGTSVLAVLPDEERSWIAQAISRTQEVRATETELEGTRTWLLSGTPADCTSIGIEHLVRPRPEMFFSGINFGVNAGLGFYLHSGTIGAVRQAFLHGVPAVGFSVLVPPRLFLAWEHRDFATLAAHRPEMQSQAALCAKIGKVLIENRAWEHADFYSVNLPWELAEPKTVRATRLEPQDYAELFIEVAANTFKLRPNKRILQPLNSTIDTEHIVGDLSTVLAGEISITPLCYTIKHRLAEAEQFLRSLADGPMRSIF